MTKIKKQCKGFNPKEAQNNDKYLKLQSEYKAIESQLREILKSIKVSQKRLDIYRSAIIDIISAHIMCGYTGNVKYKTELETAIYEEWTAFYFLLKRISRRNNGIGMNILTDYRVFCEKSFLECLMLLIDHIRVNT